MGLLTIVPDYRNFPQGDIKDMMADISAAVKWTEENAGKYGGDREKIVLAGQSAGAHICMCALVEALRQRIAANQNQSPRSVTPEQVASPLSSPESEESTPTTKASGQQNIPTLSIKCAVSKLWTGIIARFPFSSLKGFIDPSSVNVASGKVSPGISSSSSSSSSPPDLSVSTKSSSALKQPEMLNLSAVKMYFGISGPYNLQALAAHIHSRGLDASILDWICKGDLVRFSPSLQLAGILESLSTAEAYPQSTNNDTNLNVGVDLDVSGLSETYPECLVMEGECKSYSRIDSGSGDGSQDMRSEKNGPPRVDAVKGREEGARSQAGTAAEGEENSNHTDDEEMSPDEEASPLGVSIDFNQDHECEDKKGEDLSLHDSSSHGVLNSSDKTQTQPPLQSQLRAPAAAPAPLSVTASRSLSELGFPPVALFHGSLDVSVPSAVSAEMASVICRGGGDVFLRMYEGWAHTDPILEGPLTGDCTLTEDVARQVATVFPPERRGALRPLVSSMRLVSSSMSMSASMAMTMSRMNSFNNYDNGSLQKLSTNSLLFEDESSFGVDSASSRPPVPIDSAASRVPTTIELCRDCAETLVSNAPQSLRIGHLAHGAKQLSSLPSDNTRNDRKARRKRDCSLSRTPSNEVLSIHCPVGFSARTSTSTLAPRGCTCGLFIRHSTHPSHNHKRTSMTLSETPDSIAPSESSLHHHNRHHRKQQQEQYQQGVASHGTSINNAPPLCPSNTVDADECHPSIARVQMLSFPPRRLRPRLRLPLTESGVSISPSSTHSTSTSSSSSSARASSSSSSSSLFSLTIEPSNINDHEEENENDNDIERYVDDDGEEAKDSELTITRGYGKEKRKGRADDAVHRAHRDSRSKPKSKAHRHAQASAEAKAKAQAKVDVKDTLNDCRVPDILVHIARFVNPF